MKYGNQWPIFRTFRVSFIRVHNQGKAVYFGPKMGAFGSRRASGSG